MPLAAAEKYGSVSQKVRDMSRFIEKSARWRTFDKSIEEARSKFADMPNTDLQVLIDEATQSVRDEMHQEFLGKKVDAWHIRP